MTQTQVFRLGRHYLKQVRTHRRRGSARWFGLMWHLAKSLRTAVSPLVALAWRSSCG
jgi:hypothetical protein